MYSISVGIFYIKSWQVFRACMRIELCAPTFSFFSFIAAVSFWLIVLYLPITLASKASVVSEQIRRNWWIALLVIALAVWHVSVRLVGIIPSLENPALIAYDVLFYPAMLILLPWLFWLLLKFCQWSSPTLPSMVIYSVSAAYATIRLWIEALVYRRYCCEGMLSVPLFLAEVAMWFTALYVLMKLTLRIERQGIP